MRSKSGGILVGAKRIIKEVDLISDSVRKAHYHLSLSELPHDLGYVITKESGPSGQGQVAESWYRGSLGEAEKKYEGILRLKTSRTTGRKYQVAEKMLQESQLSLLA